VSPSERFVGPLNPIVLLLLSSAVWTALDRLSGVRRLAKDYAAPVAALASCFLALGLALKARDWGAANPFALDRLEPCYQTAVEWASTRGGDVVYGPSADLPSWLLSSGVRPLPFPERGPKGGFGAWLEDSTANAAVVDWDMASQPFLEGFIEEQGDRGVRVLRIPAGWKVAAADKEHDPPRLVLLERALKP
jgi:hypothetical protein